MIDDLLEGIEGEDERRERRELVERLLADGFTEEEVRDAARRGRLALLPIDRVLRRDDARYSPRDIAEATGLSLDFLRRLWRALGLANAGDDEIALRDEDLEAARGVAQFVALGLPDAQIVLITQVLGHGMARLAETLREVVGDALLQAGDSEAELGLRYAQAGEFMVPMLSPLLSYVLNVHLSEQLKSDVILQHELSEGRFEEARDVTVCFADLVGFTRFGETVPPAELGAAGRRLTELAVQAAEPPVRLVKMIGDAAMLVSPHPEPLVRAALALAHGDADLPPVRVGVASGTAVAHCGDWLGTPVNLASRITGVARPDSVLASREVREATRDAFDWSRAGTRRLKGVREPVALYRARALLP
ncbi:MAG TPA: adenylate cyclase regulatory domain-containing protein [Solirubrobacteraceae bacterium]|nr:adenylate cyclase regulatory domain-containing protein [Solirubrobacteraceae bacterium]